MNRPSSLSELAEFYRETFLPLYDLFQSQKKVPQELTAEITAAWDHLFGGAKSFSKEPPTLGDIQAAAGHLKRGTFDGFKILFDREIRERREEFAGDRYADVHDGTFRKEVASAWMEARLIFLKARSLERNSRIPELERWDAAFAEYQKLVPFSKRFAQWEADPAVVRVRGKTLLQRILSFLAWLVTLLLGAVLGHYIPKWLNGAGL